MNIIKMKGKIFCNFLVFLLAISLISAATTTGTLKVSTGSAQIVVNCEDWSGSSWGSCINGVQTFFCFNKNSYFCNTINSIPAQCGNTQACNIVVTPTPSPGGTGSNPSGGSPSTNNNPASTPPSNSGSCVENWKCNDWSNVNEQCGTRTCEDLNKCGTTQLKPKVSEKCSTVGFLSFTGAVTGIGNFAKSGEGIATFLGLIMVVVLTILITSIRRKRLTNEKNSEPKTI